MRENSYPIHIDTEIKKEQLQKGLFLFLFRATRIPPHLGIILNGKLFDITLNGPQIGLDVNQFFDTIIKKYTKTVFVELELPEIGYSLQNILEEKMLKYNSVSTNVSCIKPIKEFIAEVYKEDVSNVNFVFDLLPVLKSKNILKASFHLNLSRDLYNSFFYITKYTREDIDRCMEALNRKEVLC